MKRWIYADRYVGADPEVLARTLLERSAEVVEAATTGPRSELAVDGSLIVDLGARVAGVDLSKQVRVRTGASYRADDQDDKVVLPVTWGAEPVRAAFPTFEGSLELESLDAGVAHVSLAGCYEVPLGAVGAMIDATLLRNVARSTAELLVRDVADALARVARVPGTATPEGPQSASLRVADVMTRDPLVIDADLPLRDAARLLFHTRTSGAPVVSASGELVGVLSERDLLVKEATARLAVDRRADEEHRRRHARTAGEACSHPVHQAAPGARLSVAAREMLDRRISRLVVVEDGAVVGVLSRRDVLAALIRDDSEVACALQPILDDAGADDVRVSVESGEVTLSGTVAVRSQTLTLADRVAEVSGVMSVDADGLTWREDDLMRFRRGPRA
jgi:CBS domain-containing protein